VDTFPPLRFSFTDYEHDAKALCALASPHRAIKVFVLVRFSSFHKGLPSTRVEEYRPAGGKAHYYP